MTDPPGKRSHRWDSPRKNKNTREKSTSRWTADARHGEITSSRTQQNHRKRRSNHKRRRQDKVESSSESASIGHAIEAQLELQRQHQQEKNRRKPQDTTGDNEPSTAERTKRSHPKPPTLGDYHYDPQQNAYYPLSHLRRRQAETSESSCPPDESLAVDATKTRRRHDWLFSRQACLDPLQRHRLAAFGSSQTFLERIRLTSSAASFHRSTQRRGQRTRMEWGLLFGANSMDETEFYSDLTCKIHRPAWLRTFDVTTQCPASKDSGRGAEGSMQWQVATVVENGFEVRSRWSRSEQATDAVTESTNNNSASTTTQREFLASHFTPQTVRYLRQPFSQQQDSERTLLMRLDSNENRSSLALEDTCEQSTTTLRLQLMFPANDVVGDTSNGFMLASSSGPPRFVSLVPGMQAMAVRPKGLVSSEVICLEQIGEQKYIFGHRDGTVTIYDRRSPRMAHIVGKCNGSVATLRSLDELQDRGGDRENLILTRTQGMECSHPCTLWDIRKTSSSSSSSSVGDHGQTLNHHPVIECQLPAQANANPRLTQRCNGLAVDELGTTLFAPFVEEHDDSPCLGVWSLITGEWIGFRKLATPSSDEIPLSSASTVSWVELCSRRTKAWEWPSKKYAHVDADTTFEYSPVVKGSKFGLWYKCGQSPTGHDHPGILPPPAAGNIHHIVV